MQNRRKDTIENHFGNHPTALFYVKFVDGIFINIDTNEPLSFKNDSLLKISTTLSSIKDENYDEVTKVENREILPAGSKLYFSLRDDFETLFFSGVLMKPLFMTKKNNKDSVISNCFYKIEKVESRKVNEIIDLDFRSLNQAFFQMSMRFRKDNNSHVCNIYKTFTTSDNRFLEEYRF